MRLLILWSFVGFAFFVFGCDQVGESGSVVNATGEIPTGTWYVEGDTEIDFGGSMRIWSFDEDGKFLGVSQTEQGCLVMGGTWEIRRGNIWIGLDVEKESFEGSYSINGIEMEVEDMGSKDRVVWKKSNASIWATAASLELCVSD